mmetsp:Transcript_46896/g.54343  ORF Transcript_46896/g.54343 Transcript_46896/m.54343 type:complete len:180 (-) Transcript_46896:235-774(-)
MGAAFRKLLDSLFRAKDVKILILGLDSAGKTTIVYRLNFGELVNTTPTIGFNIETVEYNRAKFAIWDVGGQTAIRKLWRHYYQGTHGIIFVVDSSDRERIELAKDELHSLMANKELKDAVLLVLANKQDLNELKVDEVEKGLELDMIKGHRWSIQGCSGKNGTGITTGLDWLCKAIAKK